MSETRLPAEMRLEIATLARDITAPIAGFTLSTRDDILARRGGGDGLRLYQDLARDGHAGSVLRKRRQAVVARPWGVEPASDAPADIQAAALLRAALGRINFDRACQGLLSSVLTGIAVAEVLWQDADLVIEDAPRRRWIVPADIVVRNPRRFVFDREMNLRLLTWENPTDGMTLPERKFLVARFWAEENEDPYGRGLGHDLFWPVYFKRNAVALWNALIEKFGLPFVYAEYPQGTPLGDRQMLLGALQDMARGAGLVVPQGTLIKFLEAGASGAATGRLHAELVDVMDAEISKIVLGETLSTEMGANGARAASETHDGVRQELADQDADLLSAGPVAALARWITEINLPGASPPTVWRRAPEEPDLLARAKLDETLFKVGFEPTEDYVRETYGAGYRRVRGTAPGMPDPVSPPGTDAQPDPAPDPAFAAGPEDAVGRIADRLVRDAGAAQAHLLAAIRAEVEDAASFADLEVRLARLAGALPVRGIAEKLGPAFMLAWLAGAAEVDDAAP
jgi:phage gp29-like protein